MLHRIVVLWAFFALICAPARASDSQIYYEQGELNGNAALAPAVAVDGQMLELSLALRRFPSELRPYLLSGEAIPDTLTQRYAALLTEVARAATDQQSESVNEQRDVVAEETTVQNEVGADLSAEISPAIDSPAEATAFEFNSFVSEVFSWAFPASTFIAVDTFPVLQTQVPPEHLASEEASASSEPGISVETVLPAETIPPTDTGTPEASPSSGSAESPNPYDRFLLEDYHFSDLRDRDSDSRNDGSGQNDGNDECDKASDAEDIPTPEQLLKTGETIKASLRAGRNSWEIVDSAFTKEIRLALFGENHIFPPHYPSVLRSYLKEGDYVFLEITSSLQGAIDGYLEGKMTFHELLAVKDEEIVVVRHFKDAIVAAKDLKLKVVCMDAANKNESKNRDLDMAINIARVMNAKPEIRAIGFVGAAHLKNLARQDKCGKVVRLGAVPQILLEKGLKREEMIVVTIENKSLPAISFDPAESSKVLFEVDLSDFDGLGAFIEDATMAKFNIWYQFEKVSSAKSTVMVVGLAERK